MSTAIYVRQSLDKKDSISIETQIELCKGELSSDESFFVYSDKGFSGKDTNRPGFKEMMDAVQHGNIERIIIYRLDRISRSVADFSSIMEVLEAKNVTFTSVNEKFDTSTPIGKAMLYIIAVFAQMERETIAERIKDNYYSRGKTGVWLGGPAPLGFNIEKSVINGKNVSVLKPAKELEIIKGLFLEYADTTKSLGEICRELTNSHPDVLGVWTSSKLSRVLHNPIYVKADADIYNHYKQLGCILVNEIDEYDGSRGVALYGKRDRGANKYNALTSHVAALSLTEGIVDSDTFLRCQYKLSKNKQLKNTGKGMHTWMTGLIKCKHCGYSMVVKIFNNIKYLYCSGRQYYHVCNADISAPIILSDIEAAVSDMVLSYLKNIDLTSATKRDESESNEINLIKIQIHKLDEEIERLINALTSTEGATIEYITNKINSLDSDKKELIHKLEKHRSKKIIERIPSPDEWENADFMKKREISHLLIDKILVTEHSVDIIWKY